MSEAERSCTSCGHHNRPQARFCESCGKPIEVRCPACGNPQRGGARFCDACGVALEAPRGAPAARESAVREVRAYTPKHLADRILGSRSALEGERKQVTVLFADVTGSMELAEQVDPEDWHRILERFFEILTEGVHRFEGTINQYTGDGVMALFGAPLAHEDHAHRACYAAYQLGADLHRFAQELKRERGLTFATRMGLNSGEVVVGKIGDDLRMDYTAQGHVVGVAARLQALADPGRAYVSETTAALVQGFFELEPLGSFRLKGVTQPMEVFALAGVGRMRTRLDVSRARGLTRFVGRQDEMAVLEAARARASEGREQIVGVVADAGTGKSRLCTELAERCRARGVAVREARGVAHGKLLPFLPLLELLRGIFALRDQETAAEARQKIAGTLVLLDRRFEEALPIVFELLGVPDPDRPAPVADPADRRRQLFAIIARVVRGLGEREPNVVLLEDLHWFDDATVSFLDSLVEAIAGTKTLLLLNFRPEFRAAWMARATYQQLPLLPLGGHAVGELLDDLLGPDPSLAELRELIRGRTGGNPFFVEEVVQSLVEAGNLDGTRGAHRLVQPLPTLRVPPTVQALLAARIDRLAERERRVLQAAAVVGKRFPESILRRITDTPEGEIEPALATLRARDFVFEEVLFPETEYAFKHPLTQEVAYGSQLVERRRTTHAAVARLFEDMEPAKHDERAALLAHHWEAAGEATTAAAWHRRAAEWSERHSPSSAVAHWRALRRLAPEISDPAERVRQQIAATIGIVRAADYDVVKRDEMDSAFEEGRRLAVEIGDFDAQVRILLAYSALVLEDGAFDKSAALLAESEAAAAATGDPELKFVVRGHAAYARVMRGEQERALELYDQAFALLGDTVPTQSFVLRRYLGAGTNRAMINAERGRLDDATSEIRRLNDLARRSRDLAYECITELSLARLGLYRGEGRDALPHARAALEGTERLGALGFRVISRLALGAAHVLCGEYDQGLAVLEDAQAMAKPEVLGPNQRLQLSSRLAEAHLGRGDMPSAFALSSQAAQSAVGVKRLGAADAFLAFARVRLAAGAGHETEIERALDSATDVARHCGAPLYEASILAERGRLARLRGDRSADAILREALERLTSMGATGHARRVTTELGLPPARQSA